MRLGGRYRFSLLRLIAVALVCGALSLPLTVAADSRATGTPSTLASVSIEIPRDDLANPDWWAQAPLIAQLIPQGPGVVWYRFGAGPGPWQRSYGFIAIPEGKQTVSAVLVAPDGIAGPVNQVITRSDVHASALGETVLAGSSQARYIGTPVVAGAVTVRVTVSRQLGTVVRRLEGSNRYGTGAAISVSGFTRSDTVILATGEKFPDALTASGLAGVMGAPVLLLHRSSIPGETKNEIRRLRATRAIICGGTPAVDTHTENELRRMGLKVERLAGKTRYETAVAVSQRIQKLTGKPKRVFVVRGDQFADALIISPLAYASHSPILLTTTGLLWPSTAARLSAARYTSAVVIGGGISSRARTGITNRIGSIPLVWAGNGPYETAVSVAAREVLEGGLSWKYVGVARGDIFPDALCGGALAGKQGGVILLTPSHSLEPCVADALTAHSGDVKHCEVLGSNLAVTDAVKNEVQSIFR